MNLIGFNGGMGVGKSSAIDFLNAMSPRPIQLVKFAGPLYDIQEYIYSKIEPVYPRPADFVKDRKLLQWIGTEWGRNSISQDLWTDLWKREVEMAIAQNYLVVCDDVRFDNEAKLVKSLGGIVIRVVSDAVAKRNVDQGIQNHASEAGIDHKLVDYQICNNGSFKDYEVSLCKLYRMLGVVLETQGE